MDSARGARQAGAAVRPARTFGLFENPRLGCLFNFLRAQRLAMRTIAADFGARDQDLKTEMRFHLAAKLLQRLAEKFLDFSAAHTNDVRVLLLEASLVVMLVAAVMHQVELVDEPALLEKFQGAIDGDPIELGIFFF